MSAPIGDHAAQLLKAEHIVGAYHTWAGAQVTAVDDVDFDVHEGEVVGLAGESGSGKTTLGSIISLTAREPLVVESGTLSIDGVVQDLSRMDRIPRTWRGSVVSMLPQGAMNSISPTMRVRDLVVDVIRAHDRSARKDDALDRARDRLQQVGLPTRVLDAYPHQLSGGMKQRTVTVISTLLNPRLLIADEPTSALDVSSQKQLMEMLLEMLEQKIMGGVIFITHDLPVLRNVSNRIAVMRNGKVIEVGSTEQIVDDPQQPYTKALIGSVLVPERGQRGRRIKGMEEFLAAERSMKATEEAK